MSGAAIGTSPAQAVTRISRVATTPQTLAQAMAQAHAGIAAGSPHSFESAGTSGSGPSGGHTLDDAHRTALQAAAVLRQAIVSFTGTGSANLAPSQDHAASDKPTLSTGHGGHA
ncbi:MAG: hypothetical protein JWQ55_1628 [Rhodopila sp.]|jgi:hypothetical protein|nr:hypothetical protein [Rhodopila sp.]